MIRIKVTFCGHSQLTHRELIAHWLFPVCKQLISDGAQTFYLGGYGAFDLMAAETLRNFKTTNPQIRLVLVLPYLNSSITMDGYDESVFPPLESVPPRFAISRRNEWTVRQSDIVVACVDHSWGGAAKTLCYARSKHKRIIQFHYSNILKEKADQMSAPFTKR